MIDKKNFSLVKPTKNTPFHIDFAWWKENDNNWHVYLQSYLCEEHSRQFEELDQDTMVDWVDPQTAEVHQVDGIQHILISHCARQPEFITPQTSLVNAVFRLFLANGNTPLTPLEIAEQTDKSADMILRTIAGPRVYKGIRPCHK
jgi:hypothetical protein